MAIQTTRGPNGEDLVLLSLDESEVPIDARGHQAATRAVASGAMETLSEAETAAYLAAKRRWRSGAASAR